MPWNGQIITESHPQSDQAWSSNHTARLSLLHCQMTGCRICRQQTLIIVTQADEPLNPDS